MMATGILFLMTISRHIKFGSVGKLNSMKNSSILKHFKALIGKYVTRGFRVTSMLADNQFEQICGNVADLHAQLHITAQDKHFPVIERYNRTTKESVCGNYNILMFEHLPPVVVTEIVCTSVFWPNMFALKGGVFKTQSPSEIILRGRLNFNAHCRGFWYICADIRGA